MYHVKIISVGKTRENWLVLALQEYEKRLTSQMQVSWHLHKKEEDLLRSLEKEKNYHCLDPKGRAHTSESFANFIAASQSHTFVIGGAEGFPQQIKDRAESLISLSSLTFTHQHTRLILLEQLYRAIEINRGSSYHK